MNFNNYARTLFNCIAYYKHKHDLFTLDVVIVDFKPDIYPSGSRVISVQDIGDLQVNFSNTNEVLTCRTGRRPCCSTQPNRLGHWT